MSLDSNQSISASLSTESALARFKQYREADGRFYFKLTAADGSVLLQSLGHNNPRDAGQAIKRLQTDGVSALAELQGELAPITDQAALEKALAALLAATGN